MTSVMTMNEDVVAPEHNLASVDKKARRERAFWTFVGRLAIAAAAVFVWWLVGALGIVKVFYISSPADVAEAVVTAFGVDGFGSDLVSTLQSTFIGFLIGSFFGIGAGLGLGVLPDYVKSLFDPFITALNSLPRIALAPLFIVFFGLGEASKIAVSISLVFFVLLVNSRAGILSVNPDLLHLSQAMRFSRWQLFRKLLLPAALPSIFAGLTLGMTYSLLGVVSAEIIASERGVGVLIQQYSGTFNMGGTYAVLLVLAVVAALINEVMERGQRWLLRWQYV